MAEPVAESATPIPEASSEQPAAEATPVPTEPATEAPSGEASASESTESAPDASESQPEKAVEQPSPLCLCFSGIPVELTEEGLSSHLAKNWGEVEKVEIPADQHPRLRLGYVHFKDAAIVSKLRTRGYVQYKHASIVVSRPLPRRPSPIKPPPATTFAASVENPEKAATATEGQDGPELRPRGPRGNRPSGVKEGEVTDWSTEHAMDKVYMNLDLTWEELREMDVNPSDDCLKLVGLPPEATQDQISERLSTQLHTGVKRVKIPRRQRMPQRHLVYVWLEDPEVAVKARDLGVMWWNGIKVHVAQAVGPRWGRGPPRGEALDVEVEGGLLRQNFYGYRNNYTTNGLFVPPNAQGLQHQHHHQQQPRQQYWTPPQQQQPQPSYSSGGHYMMMGNGGGSQYGQYGGGGGGGYSGGGFQQPYGQQQQRPQYPAGAWSQQ